MMTIALGTSSDDKRKILDDVLGARHIVATVVQVAVESGIGEQPIGRDTIEHGARNRAGHALQRVPKSNLGVGMEGGIDMTPEGMFLVCSVVIRSRNGREATTWSVPRLIPDTVARAITEGQSFGKTIREYRDLWKPVDTFSAVDIEELINRRGSFTEALVTALDTILN